MVIPEGTGDRREDSNPPTPPDQKASDYAGCWSSLDEEKSEESAAASVEMAFSRDLWDIVVALTKTSDGANRFTRAINIILADTPSSK